MIINLNECLLIQEATRLISDSCVCPALLCFTRRFLFSYSSVQDTFVDLLRSTTEEGREYLPHDGSHTPAWVCRHDPLPRESAHMSITAYYQVIQWDTAAGLILRKRQFLMGREGWVLSKSHFERGSGWNRSTRKG